MIRARVTVTFVVALASLACEPTTSSTAPEVRVPQATAGQARLGPPLELGNWRYRVLDVAALPVLPWVPTEKPKGVYFAVKLELVNLGNRNYGINQWDFELRDAKGTKYDPDTIQTTAAASLLRAAALGEQMPPGVPVVTWLIFDIAPDSTGRYLYLVQGGGRISFRLALKEKSVTRRKTSYPPLGGLPAGTPRSPAG